MKDKTRSNPTDTFTGLARIYSHSRPDYPNEAIDFILKHCHLGEGSTMADVGCGTGISTRCFARRGIPIVGIEPNTDMRQEAESCSVGLTYSPPPYVKGKAEATGLDNGGVDAVLSAQAFHWFDPVLALREFHRILKPNGWVILMWNERDESDRCTEAFGKLMRSLKETVSVETHRGKAGEVLFNSRLFGHAQKILFPNKQVLDENGLLSRAFSTSYSPKHPAERKRFGYSVKHLYHEYQSNGVVMLQYETAVYLARRNDVGND